MKTPSFVALICALVIPSFAADTKTNAVPEQKKEAAITLAASAGEITAPLALKDGAISQPEKTELPAGGKAVYNFTIKEAGNYVVAATVKGEGEDANSFYLNIDAQPEDPKTIWDFEVTNGFEVRTVSWRGNGTPESNEIVPKKFKLTAGEHKLIIMGREPAELKSILIRPVAD
jgi:hypothetical protein